MIKDLPGQNLFWDEFKSAAAADGKRVSYAMLGVEAYVMAQVLQVLGVSRVRVGQLCAAGIIRKRRVGSRWVYDADDVRARAADPRAQGRGRPCNSLLMM